jgi:hypothetical protein
MTMSGEPTTLDGLSLEDLYRAVPFPNERLRREPAGNGLVIEVPRKTAGAGRRVLSWFVPVSPTRRLRLDELGAAVFADCSGERNVGDIIRRFAARFRLTFHESRLCIMMFLRTLIERGAIGVALPDRP